MSKPHSVSLGHDADEPDDFGEEIRVVNERDKIYEEQRDAARPADEVVERLLQRQPDR